MAAESNVMPTSQVVRWIVVGVLILAAVSLYFSHGLSLSPLGSAPAAVDTTPTR